MCCEQTLTPLLRHIGCVLPSTTAGAKLDESFVYKESEMHHSRVQPAQLRAVLLLFLIFSTIPVRPLVSKSTGPILAEVSGLVELWL